MFLLLEQMPLSSGVVSAIVIAVLLLLVITAAIPYLFFIRRCVLISETISHSETRNLDESLFLFQSKKL